MEEISIQTNPDYLRKIASFLNQCADSIENHENKFTHEHLKDNLANWDESFSNIIIVKK